MAFRLNGEILQSDTSEAAYRVDSKFRRVLTTLSEDAYLAAVEAAIQDLIVENETLIPLVTDAFEETFNDRQF